VTTRIGNRGDDSAASTSRGAGGGLPTTSSGHVSSEGALEGAIIELALPLVPSRCSVMFSDSGSQQADDDLIRRVRDVVFAGEDQLESVSAFPPADGEWTSGVVSDPAESGIMPSPFGSMNAGEIAPGILGDLSLETVGQYPSSSLTLSLRVPRSDGLPYLDPSCLAELFRCLSPPAVCAALAAVLTE